MKAFVILLILAGIAFAGYSFYPEIKQALESRTAQGRPLASGGDPQPIPQPEGEAPWKVRQPEPVGDGGEKPADEVDGGEDATRPSDPADSDSENQDSEPPEEEDKYTKMFPMPEFDPLEEVVGNWMDIPPSAFPREILIRQDVEVKLPGGIGSSTIEAGSSVFALGIQGETLAVAPSPESTARGTIHIDETTFKDVLAEVYEGFKMRRREQVLAKRNAARRQDRQAELAELAKERAKIELVGEKPKANPDGSVPAMIESIMAEEVTEFSVADVDRWGPVQYDEIDGDPYWIGTVYYKAETIFGTFPAEGMALMRKGDVVKWVYAGSGEPIP